MKVEPRCDVLSRMSLFVLSEGGRTMLYMIGGSPCSGKSTIASLLARQYQLLHIKLDDLIEEMLDAFDRLYETIKKERQNGR